MRKIAALFLFSVIAISAFSVNNPKSRTTQSTNQQENFTNGVNKLNKEVADIVLGYKQLICDAQKEDYDAEELIPELDKAIRKIDKGKITYRNEEIRGLNDRIVDIYNRNKSITNKLEKLRHRQTVVECQLEENPKLKNLVHMNGLYKVIGEWNALMDVSNERSFLYNGKVNALNERIKNLPYFQNQENLE